MKASVTLIAKQLENPFLYRGAPVNGAPLNGDARQKLRWFRKLIKTIYGGTGLASRKDYHPSVIAGSAVSGAVITLAAVANADTVTLNGQAMTATQHRASGTVTFASVLNNDTITVNGIVFTAKTSPTLAHEFLRGVSDTADAAAFVVAANAASDLGNGGLGTILSKSAAAIATVYSTTVGTGGNAYTLASSNGGRLAVSGATFAGGAAVGNNEFDYIASDTINATELASQIGASTTAALVQHVVGTNKAAVVTLVSVAVGDYVTLNGAKLIAQTTATDSGGARIASAPPDFWSQASSDTNDAISLVNCINAHPKLRDLFYAENTAGVVTIRERSPANTNAPQITSSSGTTLAITVAVNGLFQPTAAVFVQALEPGQQGNAKTIATSNGTRLAITGSLSRLAGGTSTTWTV